MTQSHGSLFIVSAPSGGGKTSLVARLVNELPDIVVSISHTTRPKRPAEVDGIHYFFVNDPMFKEMIAQNLFVEHAQVFNYCYGTSVAQIQHRLQNGIDVVLDIDWQGAEQIKHLFTDAVSIFILPPSMEALKQRLQERNQDPDSVIIQRMQRASNELSHYHEFDFLIVNDQFDTALDELKAIIIANRLKVARQMYKRRKLLSLLLTSQ